MKYRYRVAPSIHPPKHWLVVDTNDDESTVGAPHLTREEARSACDEMNIRTLATQINQKV